MSMNMGIDVGMGMSEAQGRQSRTLRRKCEL